MVFVNAPVTLNFVVRRGAAVVDISVAEEEVLDAQVVLAGPNNTRRVRAGTLTTDGTDGRFFYLTVADDLSVAGAWRIQGQITIGEVTYCSPVQGLSVEPRL